MKQFLLGLTLTILLLGGAYGLWVILPQEEFPLVQRTKAEIYPQITIHPCRVYEYNKEECEKAKQEASLSALGR